MPAQEPVAVFSSQNRSLMLSFSPEDGFVGRNLKGEAAPVNNVVFKDGVLRAMTPETADMVRRHPRNKSNGGNGFEEVPKSVMQAARALAGGAEAEIPAGGLTDGDMALLRALTASSVHLPPKAIPAACQRASDAIARFNVWGLKPPEVGMPTRSITARIRVLLDKLAESGIRAPEPGPGEKG